MIAWNLVHPPPGSSAFHGCVVFPLVWLGESLDAITVNGKDVG